MSRWTLVFLGFLTASFAIAQPASVLRSMTRKGRTDAQGPVLAVTTEFRPTGFVSLKGAPFSSDRRHTTTQTLSDGTRINPGVATGPKMSRDADGRTRVEQYVVGQQIWPDGRQAPPTPMLIEIDDVVDGYFYVLDTERKIAYRSKHVPVPARAVPPEQKREQASTPAAKAPPPPPKEGQQRTTIEDLGIRVIQGVQAEGERRTTIFPVGSRGNDRPMTEVSEMWTSPQLELVVLSTTKSLSHESTTELVNLSLVQPPADLFLPPSDYQVIDVKGEFTIEFRIPRPPPPPSIQR